MDLRPLALSAAGWLALSLYERRDPARTRRFGAALVLGALAAHLGQALLFERSTATLGKPGGGFSLLFVPVGLLVLASGPAAFRCLPLPLAVARLGCLGAGCCHGVAGERLPLYEGVAWLALHLLLPVLPAGVVPGLFLLVFGAMRLAQEPFRPGLIVATAAPGGVALFWGVCGVAWLWRAGSRSGDARPPSPSAFHGSRRER